MKPTQLLPVMSASLFFAALLSGCSAPESTRVAINQVSAEGIGSELGTITIEEFPGGLKFTPDLRDLVPGEHGFHVHEHPSCEAKEKNGIMVAALAAGGHYDPDHTDRHAGPEGDGHRGDLPVLVADEKGFAKTSVQSKRLTMADMRGRTLIVHAGGDNYSDNPPMGGGGSRIACGVVK